MTDPVIIGGVMVLVIGAITKGTVDIITARRTREILSTAKTIEGHVNSAAQAMAAKLDAAEKTIAALTLTVNDLKQAAALLAQSAASKKEQ